MSYVYKVDYIMPPITMCVSQKVYILFRKKVQHFHYYELLLSVSSTKRVVCCLFGALCLIGGMK